MFELIKKLFGIKSTDFAQLVREGAIILDVRTPGEYKNGHIKGSINIPVDKLSTNLQKVKPKSKAVITCCASGARSAAAKSILRSNGYISVYNGGAWQNLKRKIAG